MAEHGALTGLSPERLIRMIRSGGGAFIDFKRAIGGIDEGVAHSEVANSPHTIASLLGHVTFWQEWVLSSIRGESPPMPEHAAGGWPAVPEGEWEALVQTFVSGIDACVAVVEQEGATEQTFFWGQQEMTVGSVLLDIAVHNGYHFGQIVLLRQMLGAWPPEEGAYTW